MNRSDAPSEILDLARELGVNGPTPIEGILQYCTNRIDGWVAEVGGVTNIEALESLVTQQLQMVFEEITTDEDFDRLKEVYAKGKKDYVFAAMRTKFDEGENPTYGALVRRKTVAPDAIDRFVALIDCRGNKLARRFFTRWHEIAHRLTTHADGGATEPGYRSEHDPIERLMDDIAGHIGFYEPLFAPAFHQAHDGKPLLEFDTVESVLRTRFPTASFQSTLFACIRRMPTPVVYLEAALAHKKDVKREIEDDSPRLFAAPPPPPGELRAVKVNPNKAAQQQKFTIPVNMRVPAGSLIDRLFQAEPITDGSSSEDLSQWESKGKSLERRAVVVEARKVPDRVIAIVQPVEEDRKAKTAAIEGIVLCVDEWIECAAVEGRADMTKAKITQTSHDSAAVEAIVLRPGDITRMIFKPLIVNNKQDENKPVRGQILWQKRGKSEADHDWADEVHLRLSTMTAGSGIKLELSTDELFVLTQAVRGLYGVYWKHHKRLPRTGEEFDLAEYSKVAKTLDTVDGAAQLIEAAGRDGFVCLMKWFVSHDNSRQVIESLAKLNIADLAEINALAGIGMLKQALEAWKSNTGNADEAFWHSTLARYAFVFSQVFSTPVVMFGSKAYVGGKNIEGAGGKEPDFLLKNDLTSHLLIVEIKTPETELLGKTPYRSPNVFAVSREVAGAITQVARYKDTFLRNHGNLHIETEEEFRLCDPRCLVVIGNTAQLDNEGKKESFEHFRRSLRGTEIITFDELFRKIEILLNLLEGKVAQ